MPHIYREISLYGLHNDWIVTQNPGSRADFATLTTDSAQRNLSHEEEVSRMYEKSLLTIELMQCVDSYVLARLGFVL